MRNIKRMAAAFMASGALVATAAAPASAHGPVVTGGLINVTVVDAVDVVLTDVNVGVGVAANLAANLCDTADVNAAILAQQVVRDDDTVTCNASGGTITFSPVQR